MPGKEGSFELELARIIEEAQAWILFEEKRHRYHLVNTDGSKVSVPSVTTVIDGTLHKPALISWAAKMQREADLNVLRAAIVSGLDIGAAVGAIESTKPDAHNRIKEAAGDLGTEVHTLIERYCAKLTGLPVIGPSVSEEAHFVFAGWEQWARDVKLMPISIERRIAHRTLGYAGKLDFLGYVEDRLAIVDWKSSKAIYDSHYLQGVAYCRALAEMGLPEPEAMVCRLPKDGDSGGIEPRWVEGDYDEIFDAFTSLLKVYQWRKTAV